VRACAEHHRRAFSGQLRPDPFGDAPQRLLLRLLLRPRRLSLQQAQLQPPAQRDQMTVMVMVSVMVS